jgi:DNA adenine methylase
MASKRKTPSSPAQLPLALDVPPTAASGPFLKWAGGKSQLLEQFTPFFPKQFDRYAEPFVGSGAVFWHLIHLRDLAVVTFAEARLSDSNGELVNCYAAVRDHVEELIAALAVLKREHNEATYYRVRGQNTKRLTPLRRAARLIYLNKTCFNGLYRVNSKGQFNVPIGSYVNPSIFDPNRLRLASAALKGVDIVEEDFRRVLDWSRAGDFVYFDPPYVPISSTSSFTSYTKASFGPKEQEELADVFRELTRRGTKAMLSNSWVPFTLARYQEFNVIEVKAARVINSNADRRGKVSELLVINYSPGG